MLLGAFRPRTQGKRPVAAVPQLGVLNFRSVGGQRITKLYFKPPDKIVILKDDDFVGMLTKNILNKLALMGRYHGVFMEMWCPSYGSTLSILDSTDSPTPWPWETQTILKTRFSGMPGYCPLRSPMERVFAASSQ